MQQEFDQSYQPQPRPRQDFEHSYRPEPRRFEPERNEPRPRPPMSEITPKKEQKSCPTALIIILLILAVAGVGLGVWGLIRPDKIETITEYKEITKECEAEKLSSEYIYISEWGIKIKKPENLKNISYTVGYEQNGSMIAHFTGIPASASIDIIPQFATTGKNLGTIAIITGEYDCNTGCGEIVFEKEDTKIIAYHWQTAYSVDYPNEDNLDLADSAQELIYQMITDSSNYSAF